MNVKEIVRKYLEDNGYDGLYGESCGCQVSDLAPCCCGIDETGDCEAGYKIPCDPETCASYGDCEFHIGPKPEIEE